MAGIKYGVIDIGSNSVRLMLSEEGKTLSKEIIITKLSEGLGKGNRSLSESAVERTAQAVSYFFEKAKSCGADKILAFGTAALRLADNPSVFLDRVKNLCGLSVDVVAGETEAEMGYIGVLGNGDGGVIDIGGASTEVIVRKNGKTVYAKSVPIGAVKLFDAAGNERQELDKITNEFLKEFGEVPKAKFYGIGGTITTASAIALSLEPYDPEKTHGYVLKKEYIDELSDKLLSMTEKERCAVKGLQKERAKVIGAGLYILKQLFGLLKITEITVSERDNLEGYLSLKTEKQ